MQKKHKSTPPLKAPWFEDEEVDVAAAGELSVHNTLKEPRRSDVAIESMTIQGFFDRLASDS